MDRDVFRGLYPGTSAGRTAQGAPPPGQVGGPGGGSPGGPGGRQPAPATPFPLTLTLIEGSQASYRVREQLAGIPFPSDAVGFSNALTGTIVLKKDGSIDTSASKLSFDLRTLHSDQPKRDGYIQHRTLQSDQYPMPNSCPRASPACRTRLTGSLAFS